MFGFNPNKIYTKKTANIERHNPQELFALAKQEAVSVEIKQEDRSLEGRLLAFPNGPESNLSEQYWRLVRTPSFKKFFGDSNMVDENGEPVLVFHTTNEDLSDFDSFSYEKSREIRKTRKKVAHGESGFYFTDGDYSYGKNKLTAFLRGHVKAVAHHGEVAHLSEEDKVKLLKDGYTGAVFLFDDAEKEIRDLKKYYREHFAPKKTSEKIFFGLNKLSRTIFPTNLTSEKRQTLETIKDKTRLLNRVKKNQDSYIFEAVVFESDQIMITEKENAHELSLTP